MKTRNAAQGEWKETREETLTIEDVIITKDTTAAITTMTMMEMIEADETEMKEKTTKTTEAGREVEVAVRTHTMSCTKEIMIENTEKGT